MLKIRYYKKFKGDEDFLVVTGNADAYRKAISYLEKADGCLLSSSDLFAIEYLGPIKANALTLTKGECSLLSKICRKLVTNGKAAHDYLSAQNLPDVDFLVSYGEYENLP